MTRTAGARIGCQRPSRFWGLGCPKIYHEVEDTLAATWRTPPEGLESKLVPVYKCQVIEIQLKNRKKTMRNPVQDGTIMI
ncbi:hypothetical protein [Thiolapillus sp.]|uniref:hypothetical protein n=1 Tax=Thiolapillus sp. TaxID=2017437 RepID=UPI003AF5324B